MLLLRREFQYQKPCKTLVARGELHSGLAKSILRQKKNYGNSNISPCKNVIFKKIL
jgi:hypothetical protein